MSGRVLRFEGSAHNQVMRLLPWYVNGTLEGDELLQVAQHLIGCAECRGEVDELRRLQSVCARRESAPDATPSFVRLRHRLQEDRARPPSRWDGLRRNWRRAPTWLRITLAAQSCVVFALAGVLVGQQLSADRSITPPAPMYRALGNAAPMDHARGNHDARLVVVFASHISHAEMQRLLRMSRTRIVDGPNDVGAYVLVVPANDQKAALDALRGERGVAMVESLESEREAGGKR